MEAHCTLRFQTILAFYTLYTVTLNKSKPGKKKLDSKSIPWAVLSNLITPSLQSTEKSLLKGGITLACYSIAETQKANK